MKRSRRRVGTGRSHSPWGDQSGAKRDSRGEKGMPHKVVHYGSWMRAARNAWCLDGARGGSHGCGQPVSVGIARIPQPPNPV